MKRIEIKGLDLKVDPSIQQICEASNATSGSTRSVLYVLVLVNILALITVINTHKYNWTQARIAYWHNNITQNRRDLKACKDSIAMQDTLMLNQKRLDNLLRNQVESYQTVRIPVLGNAFDVNNLGIVSGITFLVLLIILQFTLAREINNLKIALNAISERYTDFANEKEFGSVLVLKPEEDRDSFLVSINYTRRQHHYDFLSMNEVFNLPPLKNSDYNYSSITHKIVMHMFWFPFFVYALILINDLTTIRNGLEITPGYTIITFLLSVLFGIWIAWLSYICTVQKKDILELYSRFRVNDFTFNSENKPITSTEH